ncbi:MAG: histidine kinase [Lewinellaceae bacterium]|nr:histidine kinase [Lewinellaceae bacterium]
MKCFLPLFIFLLSGFWAGAQTPVFQLRDTRELANAPMSGVFQDSRGWLWFGSDEGLYRFDGMNFLLVGLPDGSAPSPVSALYEWNGRLWVGFVNGAIGFMPVNTPLLHASVDELMQKKEPAARLSLWDPEEGLPKAAVTAFVADKSGGFWIATYGEGVYCLKDKRLYQFDQSDDGMSGDEIYALACDSKGRVWAATDAGISICSMPEPGEKRIRRFSVSDGLPDEIITALLADKHGDIWIGTQEKGVHRYNIEKQRFDFQTNVWSWGAVTSLALYEKSSLWVGTLANGPVCVELSTGVQRPLPAAHPLRHVKTEALCKDREGLLWAILDNGAIYSANVRFGLLETPFGNTQALLRDSRNRLWAGSAEGLFLGVSQRVAAKSAGAENWVFKKILTKPENIISLWESPLDGSIWAGTFGNGVYVVSPEGRVLKHLSERDGLFNGNVLSIAGNDRQVWLATLGGVSVLDLKAPQAIQNLTRQSELGTGYVYKVFLDSKGRVWFCTDGNGLIVYENGRYRQIKMAGDIPLKRIYCITEDKRGHIWFSSDNAGLFAFDGEQFRRYTLENHLHSEAIVGLAADRNGFIVVAYEDGFDLLNPERIDHIIFCDETIGAPRAEVNLNAICRDAQGNVWLGVRDGMVRSAAFYEDFLDDPQPGITSVSGFSQNIDFLSVNSFAHNQNYFIFNFTGLWYTDPESVRYRYHLDGFDLDWKVSKDPLTSYPKLPPGKYTFRVQTSEHGNFENVPEASWSFVIRKPFWAEWWFILLGTITGGAFFYGFIRNREQRLNRVAQLKRDRVESQFVALKSQINPHFLFNSFNTLITTIEENPKVAVEYVEHLSDFYRSIIAYRERDFISLQEELDLVRNYEFLLKKRFEDGLFLVNRLEGKTGLVMPLSIQMLVENAVKHNVISASKPLRIELFTESDDYIVVRNNIQPKLKPEPSTHFGLQSIINRYALLGERPVLVEDNAAFFTVKIPLKK